MKGLLKYQGQRSMGIVLKSINRRFIWKKSGEWSFFKFEREGDRLILNFTVSQYDFDRPKKSKISLAYDKDKVAVLKKIERYYEHLFSLTDLWECDMNDFSKEVVDFTTNLIKDVYRGKIKSFNNFIEYIYDDKHDEGQYLTPIPLAITFMILSMTVLELEKIKQIKTR